MLKHLDKGTAKCEVCPVFGSWIHGKSSHTLSVWLSFWSLQMDMMDIWWSSKDSAHPLYDREFVRNREREKTIKKEEERKTLGDGLRDRVRHSDSICVWVCVGRAVMCYTPVLTSTICLVSKVLTQTALSSSLSLFLLFTFCLLFFFFFFFDPSKEMRIIFKLVSR